MTVGSILGYSSYYTNPIQDIGTRELDPNAIQKSQRDEGKNDKNSPYYECETCKNRKYQDGSDEVDVSFKAASHVAPEAAASAVRNHEMQHVSNAYQKAAKDHAKVLSANVAIHTSVCPECGRSYVSGGTTHTMIKYTNEENPYQKDLKTQDSTFLTGANLDYTL